MTNALVKYSKPYSAQFGKFSKMSGILYLMGYEKDEIRTMKTLDPEELYGLSTRVFASFQRDIILTSAAAMRRRRSA